MQRREILKLMAALAAARLSCASAWAASSSDFVPLGKPQAFDFAWLKGRARNLASQAYRPPENHANDALKKLDWDQYQAIRFRPDHALWAHTDSRFQLQFFHLGLFYQTPVQLYELRDGQAQQLAYNAAMFDYGKSGLSNSHLMADLGFAGFRAQFHTDWQRDVVAFLGASYFRAVGADMQYGLSARRLAIDCGMDRPEEFPSFTSFWFERPAVDSGLGLFDVCPARDEFG